MELYKKSIIPQTEANLKSAFVAYEARQIDFLSLLESEGMQIQAELDYYKAQTRLFKAVADLEKAIGIAFSEM
jgi:outer membrane protein TolC